MKVGDQVGWQWGTGITTGHMLEVYAERIQIESNVGVITRKGRSDDRAIFIKSDNGSLALKFAHELQVVKGAGDV